MVKMKLDSKVNKVVKVPYVSDGTIKKMKHKFKNKRNGSNLITVEKQVEEVKAVPKVEHKEKEDMQTLNKRLTIMSSDYMEQFCILWNKYKKTTSLLVKSGTVWTDKVVEETPEEQPIPLNVRKKLKDHAKKMYENELEVYQTNEEQQSRTGDKKFRKALMKKGTTKDKLTSLVLQCLDSPVHSLSYFRALIEYMCPKLRHACSEALKNIAKLLDTSYLPQKKVAVEFECHNFRALIPLLHEKRDAAQKQLVLWYFEDELRKTYLLLISNLSKLSHDQMEISKKIGIQGLKDLAVEHPNQCIDLVLRELINKLGDTVRRNVGKVKSMLEYIQYKNPHLKFTLVSLVEELLYRANVTQRTQFYCIAVLVDVKYSRIDGGRLAERVVQIYFDFFQMLTKKGSIDNKFMAVLLAGLNRAFPNLEPKSVIFLEEKINILYRLCHMVNFNVATKTLQLIYQVQHLSISTNRRYCQVVYSKLLDANFGCATSNSAFLNLLFKVMYKEDNMPRLRAFVKRLLQIAKYQSPHTICGILFLISEVVKDNPHVKSLKSLLIEVDPLPAIKNAKNETENEECFSDLDDNKEVQCEKIIHKKGKKISNDQKEESSDIRVASYDPVHRLPEFCGANFDPIYELIELCNHYHPSASLFASTLSDGGEIEYTGDPLKDFTFTRFLERFILRNPKEIKVDSYKNIHKDSYRPSGVRALMVNSEKFKNLREEKVPEEDKFFHKFYNVYEEKKEKKEKKDTAEVEDEEFDEYLQKTSGLDEEEINFAENAVKIALKKDEDESSGGEDDFGDGASGSEEEVDEQLEDNFNDFGDDDFGEDDFEDDDDLDFSDEDNSSKNTKKPKGKSQGSKRKFRPDDDDDGDDFDRLLEDNVSRNKSNRGTSEEVFNRDKSHAKQMRWEEERHRSFGGNKKANSFGKKPKIGKQFKAGKKFSKSKKFKK